MLSTCYEPQITARVPGHLETSADPAGTWRKGSRERCVYEIVDRL